MSENYIYRMIVSCVITPVEPIIDLRGCFNLIARGLLYLRGVLHPHVTIAGLYTSRYMRIIRYTKAIFDRPRDLMF